MELPIPTPKKNEVLVKVEACSMDWKVHMCCMNPVLPCRAHVPGEFMTCNFHNPAISFHRKIHEFGYSLGIDEILALAGSDIAGVVVSVGPGVTTFVPGDKVVSCLGKVSNQQRL